MPNWSEGSIKIKGSYDNIMHFIKTKLVPANEHKDWLTITEHEDGSSICFNGFKEPFDWIYISDTKRAFIIPEPYVFWVDKSNDTVIALHFAQAWGVWLDEWIEIAKQYNLAFRFFTIDCGMGLYGDEIVLPDGTIQDLSPQWDSSAFIWNCPVPWFGG